MKKEKNIEYALIFKAYQEGENSKVYLPVGIIKGKLDTENLSFISNNINFDHLIKGPKEYGFAFASSLTGMINSYKIVSKAKQKKLLKAFQSFSYIYTINENNNPVIGVQSLENDDDIDILYEDELLDYYLKNFPSAKDIIKLLRKASGELNLDIENISNELDLSFSNSIQSRQILTSIWKHMHSKKPYHIFINGSEISPKKEIIKSICEEANIPYLYINAVENYDVFDIEDMAKELLKKCDFNLEEAQNAVLIIDNIDKLAVDDISSKSLAEAQLNLYSLLKGEPIEIYYKRHKKLDFDPSNLMIIGMGNFENDELQDIKINGFGSIIDNKKNNKDKYKVGMLDGLFDNFNIIIQMDNPNLQDYESFLNNRETAGIINNKSFFDDLNISLEVSEETIKEIAKYAYKNKLSLNDVKELIENMLSLASFEIAKNPALYEKLVITSETIKDNTKYILTKRKCNK